MNNPVGLAFTETGERFLSGTFFVLNPATHPGQRDGVSHAIYKGMFGRKNPSALSGHPRTGDYFAGHGAYGGRGPFRDYGVAIAQQQCLGPEIETCFVADFNLRRISRYQLLGRSGSSFASEIDVLAGKRSIRCGGSSDRCD